MVDNNVDEKSKHGKQRQEGKIFKKQGRKILIPDYICLLYTSDAADE